MDRVRRVKLRRCLRHRRLSPYRASGRQSGLRRTNTNNNTSMRAPDRYYYRLRQDVRRSSDMIVAPGSATYMGTISSGLAALSTMVAVSAVLGRLLAPLAREVRLTAIAFLALRGSQPGERAEILRALATVTSRTGRTAIPNSSLVDDGGSSAMITMLRSDTPLRGAGLNAHIMADEL